MLFSIVTVSLNSGRTIARTIESVLNQSFDDYEYIIIDGKSVDDTVDIIKSYEIDFGGRLSYLSEPDGGIYDAFNKGCRLAKGDYIWIVNSDDYIEPESLDKLHSVISKYDSNNFPIISGALRFIYDNGLSRIEHFDKDSAALAFSLADIGISHPSTLIPRRIYEQVGLYDDRYRIMADMDWFRRAYIQGCTFVWIPDVLNNMTEGGVSTTFNLSKLASDRWLYTCKFYNGNIIRVSAFMKWMYIHMKGVLKDWLVKKKIIKIDPQ